MVTKAALREELLAKLRADLETLERAHRAVVEGATHPEAKPENDKDTRATEASYLARGQAARIDDLRTGVALVGSLSVGDGPLRRVVLGALVTVLVTTDDDDVTETLFVAPAGGGTKLAGGGVRVVTPEAPLGRGLLGKEADDEFDLVVGAKTRSLRVREVS